MINNEEQFKKTIFVNCTAATSGGALTVLQQFLNGISKYDKGNLYYIFCTAPEIKGYESYNIKVISNIYKRKWIGRIWWDNIGLEKWIGDNKIEPDLVVSLQNTGVRLGRRIKQIIYYHQSLPMYEYKWSLIKKQERKLWIYKNIYPWFVKKHFYKNDILVVQSEWMKEAANRVLDIDLNKIKVINPTVQIKEDREIKKRSGSEENTFIMIYPATNVAFKNHKVIYQALKIVNKERPDIIKNLRFYVTLEKGERDQIDGAEFDSNIEFLGNLEYEKLLDMYSNVDSMVFPSYLETVGLPLLEAAYFGLPIIASDLPYARETVRDYKGVAFVKYDDPEAWADAIISAYENRKKYDRLLSDQRDTWEDMFLLIKQQLV